MPIITLRDYEKELSSNLILSGDQDVPEEWRVSVESSYDYDEELIRRRQKELIDVKPSDFVQFAIRMRDMKEQTFKPFSFDGREYLIPIYNTRRKRTLLKTSRQCEKSTMLGNKLLAYSCMQVAFNSLYVSPTQIQAKVFSEDRIKEPIDTSEYLRSWTTTKLMDSVSHKKFINRSQILLRYAFLSADRCRGIAGIDCLAIDELQDILQDNIPVIEQTTSHGDPAFRFFLYAGTPKSLDNPIELYWSKFSTQNEWAIPCHRHTYSAGGKITNKHWNILIDDRNIGLKGLICERCGHPISARDAECRWVAMNPNVLKDEKISERAYDGYHISQLMVEWIDWNDIVLNYTKYPKAQFFNEVLGISYDSGTKPLTRQDILNNCDPRLSLDGNFLDKLRMAIEGIYPVYAGIDWSGGSETSHTVLCLATYLKDEVGNSFFTPFYWRRFEAKEQDPEIQIRIIEEILDKWKVRRVGCDYGGGYWPNDKLTRRFGVDRIWKYQYANPKIKVKWEPGLKRYILHRSEVMSDVINAIKGGRVFRFPKWADFETPFANDFLSITAEFNETRRVMMYQKSLNGTDDSFHALTTCFLASMIDHPRPQVIAFNDMTSYTEF